MLTIGQRVQDNATKRYGEVVERVQAPVPSENFYYVDLDHRYGDIVTRYETEVSVIPQVGDRVYIEPCNPDEWEETHKFGRRTGVVLEDMFSLGVTYHVRVLVDNVTRRHTKRQVIDFAPHELSVL